MNTPYGPDYLKKLVSESLDDGGNDDGTNFDPTDQAIPFPALYGYGNPGAEIMADNSPSMGPRFQQAVRQGGMTPPQQQMSPEIGAMQGAPSPMVDDHGMPNFNRLTSILSQLPKGKRDFSNDAPPRHIDDMLARLARHESQGNPNAENKDSKAGGMFQYLPTTWNGHGGFESAKDAPAEMQYHRALGDFATNLKSNGGDVVKAILTHFLGASGAEKRLKNPQSLYETVNKMNGEETPASYVSSIIGKQAFQDYVHNHQSALGKNMDAYKGVYGISQPSSG